MLKTNEHIEDFELNDLNNHSTIKEKENNKINSEQLISSNLKQSQTFNNPNISSTSNKATNDISSMMHHTAMTYSSIQKMINNPLNNKPKDKTKTKLITDRKKYNGKVDRVKLYQMLNSEWKKTPILKK